MPIITVGLTWEKQGNLTQAIADLNRAIEINPTLVKRLL